jgi:hypothetical protein
MGSFFSTKSPSLTSHSTIVASSCVNPNFGMMIAFANGPLSFPDYSPIAPDFTA